MGRRRSRGSVRRLPSGRWQIRYTGPDGLRRSARATYPTKADANRALSLIDAEIIRGTWVDPSRDRHALADYAARWVQERPGLSPRTVEFVRRPLRLHIVPRLGRHDLRSITQVVRAWRQGLLDGGVGPTTVAKAYRLLRAVLSTAVDDEPDSAKPMPHQGSQCRADSERPVLTLHESLALADAIDPRYRALVLLAVFGSLRWGELMGLTRLDLDLVGATVHVRRSVAEVASKLVIRSRSPRRASARSLSRSG